MIDTKKYVKVLIDLKITPNQFLWLYLNLVRDYPLIYEYIETMGFFDYSEIQDLIDRGLVLNLNTGDRMYPDFLVITDKFASYFITLDVKDAEQFWNKYPNTIDVNGRKFKTKTLPKDEILSKYQKAINYDEKTHKIALKQLEYDIKKGLISTKIDKYIDGRPWEEYVEEEIKPNSNVI